MSRTGGFTPSTSPTGWVFIDRHRTKGFTIQWKRGDAMAYVLTGRRMGDHGMGEMLGTIPVVPTGWTDLAEIRGVGLKWVRGR